MQREDEKVRRRRTVNRAQMRWQIGPWLHEHDEMEGVEQGVRWACSRASSGGWVGSVWLPEHHPWSLRDRSSAQEATVGVAMSELGYALGFLVGGPYRGIDEGAAEQTIGWDASTRDHVLPTSTEAQRARLRPYIEEPEAMRRTRTLAEAVARVSNGASDRSEMLNLLAERLVGVRKPVTTQGEESRQDEQGSTGDGGDSLRKRPTIIRRRAINLVGVV